MQNGKPYCTLLIYQRLTTYNHRNLNMSSKILSAVNFLFFELLIYVIIFNLFSMGKEFSLIIDKVFLFKEIPSRMEIQFSIYTCDIYSSGISKLWPWHKLIVNYSQWDADNPRNALIVLARAWEWCSRQLQYIYWLKECKYLLVPCLVLVQTCCNC